MNTCADAWLWTEYKDAFEQGRQGVAKSLVLLKTVMTRAACDDEPQEPLEPT